MKEARRPTSLSVAEVSAVIALVIRLMIALSNLEAEKRIIAAAEEVLEFHGGGLIFRSIGIVMPFPVLIWSSRRRNWAAAWLFAVWTSLQAGAFVIQLLLEQAVWGPRTAAQVVAIVFSIFAIFLIFRSDARAWLRGKRSTEQIADDFR